MLKKISALAIMAILSSLGMIFSFSAQVNASTSTPYTISAEIPILSPKNLVVDPANNTLYATDFNGFSGSILPINTTTNSSGTPISISGYINQMTLDPGNNTLYATYSSGSSGYIVPIDTTNNSLGKPISISGYPGQMTLDPANNTLYATYSSGSSGYIVPIDTTNNSLGKPISISGYPGQMTLDPANNTLYTTYSNGSSGYIVPIDTTNNSSGKTISISGYINQMTLDPANNTLYAAYSNGSSGSILPIDTTNNSSGKTISISGAPNSTAIDPITNVLYFVDNNDVLHVINLVNGDQEDQIPLLSSSGAVVSYLFSFTILVNPTSGTSSHDVYIPLTGEGPGVIDVLNVTNPIPPTTTTLAPTTTSTTTTLTPTTTSTTTTTLAPTTTSTTTTLVTISNSQVRRVKEKKIEVKAKAKVSKRPVDKVVIKNATALHTGEPWSGANIYLLILMSFGLLLTITGFRKTRTVT